MNSSSKLPLKTVLSIAGSDPSGGAGIQADIKTISYLGAYAAALPTALTVQNTKIVESVEALSPELVYKQAKCVFDDIEIHAVKIGLVPNAGVVEAISMVLDEYAGSIPIVCDPVFKSSSEVEFYNQEHAQFYLERLAPLSRLMTPNINEARAFIGGPDISNVDMMVDAAMQLAAKGNCSVLITGGDMQASEITDVLFAEGKVTRFTGSRIKTVNTHGTGCALSSAIATFLAQGLSTKDAVEKARIFVRKAIETAPNIGHGAGPLNLIQD